MVIMKQNILFVLSLCSVLLNATSCKPKYSEPVLTAGDLNAARFVMIGDGHSGGYMDDALYYDGQKNGLAELLGRQLELFGGQSFTTRFVNENSVGANPFGQSRLKLGYKEDCNGVSSLSPIRVAAQGDISIIATTTFSGEALYRNFGIPGMRTTQVLSPNLAQFNPYFARIASSNTVAPIEDILATDPTFFAIYLGMEEVLKYARTGGSVDDLPSVADFTTAYTEIAQQLHNQGAKGVVATLPNITQFPYFRTIPYNGLNLDASTANLLSAVFGALGYTFNVGPNPFMIEDPDANAFGVRQINAGELLLLSIPLDSVKCNQMGSLFPFRNEFVLNLVEQQYLNMTINAYNDAIRTVATTYNLAVVETTAFYQQLFSGFTYNGVTFSAQFVSGGAFSLDGIHLNAKGNALLANEFIRVINKHYGAVIPALNANAFSGVLFP
jgi:hypothetical protein